MKTRFLLIGMILIAGVLLAGFGLDFARAQGERVTASEYPVMNWERVTHGTMTQPGMTCIGAYTALEVFDGYLYAGPTFGSSSGDTRPNLLFRTNNGTDWETLTIPGELGTSIECSYGWNFVWDMIEFNDMLYAVDGNICMDQFVYSDGEIWRSADGLSWEVVISDAFGLSSTSSASAFSILNDQLYVGLIDNVHGAQIWRSDTGDPDDWENVLPVSFPDPALYYVNEMFTFDDMIIASVNSYTDTGYSPLWLSTDGVTWNDGPTEMFSDWANTALGTMGIYNGSLYMGVWNFLTGGELWRSSDGITWTEVYSTGDSMKAGVGVLDAYDDYLYIEVEDVSLGGDYLMRSSDGINFELASWPVRTIHPHNIAFPNSHAVFQDHLYIGVWNWEVGGSIWRDAPFYIWLPWASK